MNSIGHTELSTFEYPDSGWEVVDAACGAESGGDDGG
jgi:hypothetical protein